MLKRSACTKPNAPELVACRSPYVHKSKQERIKVSRSCKQSVVHPGLYPVEAPFPCASSRTTSALKTIRRHRLDVNAKVIKDKRISKGVSLRGLLLCRFTVGGWHILCPRRTFRLA